MSNYEILIGDPKTHYEILASCGGDISELSLLDKLDILLCCEDAERFKISGNDCSAAQDGYFIRDEYITKCARNEAHNFDEANCDKVIQYIFEAEIVSATIAAEIEAIEQAENDASEEAYYANREAS